MRSIISVFIVASMESRLSGKNILPLLHVTIKSFLISSTKEHETAEEDLLNGRKIA